MIIKVGKEPQESFRDIFAHGEARACCNSYASASASVSFFLKLVYDQKRVWMSR